MVSCEIVAGNYVEMKFLFSLTMGERECIYVLSRVSRAINFSDAIQYTSRCPSIWRKWRTACAWTYRGQLSVTKRHDPLTSIAVTYFYVFGIRERGP